MNYFKLYIISSLVQSLFASTFILDSPIAPPSTKECIQIGNEIYKLNDGKLMSHNINESTGSSTTNLWSDVKMKSDFPLSDVYSYSSDDKDKAIYAIGNQDSTLTLIKYKVGDNSWSKVIDFKDSDLNKEIRSVSMTFNLDDGFIYAVVTNNNANSITSSLVKVQLGDSPKFQMIKSDQGVPKLYGPALVYAGNKKLIMLAGKNLDSPSNSSSNSFQNLGSISIYDIEKSEWSIKSTTGDIPMSRYSPDVQYVNNALYLYGGYDISNRLIDDKVWSLDTKDEEYSWSSIDIKSATLLLKESNLECQLISQGNYLRFGENKAVGQSLTESIPTTEIATLTSNSIGNESRPSPFLTRFFIALGSSIGTTILSVLSALSFIFIMSRLQDMFLNIKLKNSLEESTASARASSDGSDSFHWRPPSEIDGVEV